MHSVLSLFGQGLSEDVVRTNWPDPYREVIKTFHGEEVEPGDGVYVYIESTYDRDHGEFLPALLESIPGADIVVLTQMNDTTDCGGAWAYRTGEDGIEYLGKVHGEEGQFGRDVVEHYEDEYDIRIWTLWEAFDYGFARDADW